MRTKGSFATTEEILKYAKLFEDEITLDNLDYRQLRALCKLLEITFRQLLQRVGKKRSRDSFGSLPTIFAVHELCDLGGERTMCEPRARILFVSGGELLDFVKLQERERSSDCVSPADESASITKR